MFVAIETKPHVMGSWLKSPRLCDAEGTEVTVIDTDKKSAVDTKNAVLRVFFPGVAIDDAQNLTDLRELGKEQPIPRDCDVWPSKRYGWLIIRGYVSDDIVFIGRFYSEDQFRRAIKEKDEYEHAKLQCVGQRLQDQSNRRNCLEEGSGTSTANSNAEKSAEACYKLGNEYYEKGNFPRAIELFTEAIKKADENDSDIYKSYYNRGLAFCCLEHYAEGIQDILKVLELKPDFSEGWYILGLAKEYLNDLDGAVEAYERALKLNPDFKDAQNRKELAQSKKQKSQIGFISKASSSKKDPQEHSATLEEIRELSKDGRFEKALEVAEDALRKDPDDFQLLLSRRLIMGKIGKGLELCGLDDVKDMFDMFIINRIKNFDKPIYKARIAQCSTGIILHGPPGCGKTAFTLAIAKQEGIELVEVVLSEILNMWSGESEKRLTQIFETVKEIAKSGKPVILFIDELDALGIARSVTIESIEGSWSRDLRNTFRRLFSEIENIPNLAIIGATNYVWSVDTALKREGRLGTCIIYLPPPDAKTREEIFKLYSKDTPGHENIDFKKLGKMTEGFSPADIKKICRKVHFEIARKMTKENRQDAAADTKDYERYVRKETPTTLGWIRSVARAWAEGKIADDELDPRLLADIDIIDPRARIKREKAKHTEEREKLQTPLYVK